MIVKINADNVEVFVDGIARVHYGAYSRKHFTSRFDRSMLQDYYRFLILHSDISLVFVDGGEVAGFVVAGYNVSQGVSKFIAEKRFSVIKVFALNPRFIVEKAMSVIASKFEGKSAAVAITPFRLMSIAVDQSGQSKGVGKQMLGFLEGELVSRGVFSYGLSVRKINTRAKEFYIKNGFFLQKETKDSLYFSKVIKHG